MFPNQPSITLYYPLAEFLGAGEGLMTYTFADAVNPSLTFGFKKACGISG